MTGEREPELFNCKHPRCAILTPRRHGDEVWCYEHCPDPSCEMCHEPTGEREGGADRAITVREHFNGHCCASDPECEHSFMDDRELAAGVLGDSTREQETQ